MAAEIKELVLHDRGDGTSKEVTAEEEAAYQLLFRGKTPEQIAMEMSTRWLPHTHYFVALYRRPPRDTNEFFGEAKRNR